jgi:hypothetical protein
MSITDNPRPKTPVTREQTEPQGSKDQIAKKKSLHSNTTNNDTNKSQGNAKHAAAATSASAAAAPCCYCRACARSFHSAFDFARHLESHQHSLLQAAYGRGARIMSDLAVDLTQLALERYPHPAPALTELDAEGQEYAERMQRLVQFPSSSAAATLLLLQQSMQQVHDAGIARSFCVALAAGQQSLVEWLQRADDEERDDMLEFDDDGEDDGEHDDEECGEEGDEAF